MLLFVSQALPIDQDLMTISYSMICESCAHSLVILVGFEPTPLTI